MGDTPQRQTKSITASSLAFSFTPQKAPHPGASTPTAARKAAAPRSTASRLPPLPAPLTAKADSEASLSTPLRPVRKATDFSPFSLRPPGVTFQREEKPTYHVLNEIASPFRIPIRPSAGSTSRGRGGGDAEDGALRLSAMPAVREVKEVKRARDEDDDVGVSPRKRAPTRYTGLQPSALLSNLISGQKSSLLLFYTSLAQQLSRPGASAVAHLRRGSSVHLRLLEPLPGPTHHAIIFRCRSVAPGRGDGDEPMGDAADSGEPNVLVVFATLPADAPRVGIDPRLALSLHGAKQFEAGIWDPHSSLELPVEHGQRVLFASRYLIAAAEGG